MAKGLGNNVVVEGTIMRMPGFLLPRNTTRCVCHCQIAKRCHTWSSHSRFTQDDRKLGAAILHQVYSKLGHTHAEAIRKIQQACDDDLMGVTQIKDGCMSADSDQCSGRPSTSWNADIIDKVRTWIMEDHRLTVREIADEVGISRGSANMITENLSMRRVASKFEPRLL
jgi:hypothetical protein